MKSKLVMSVLMLSLAIVGGTVAAAAGPAPDRGFRVNGAVTAGFGYSPDHDPNSRATLVGTTESGDFYVLIDGASRGSAPEVMKFSPDGVFDKAFSKNGRKVGAGAVSFAILPDGRLRVGRYHAIGGYLPDGSIDTSFGKKGTVKANGLVDSLAVSPTGDLVAGIDQTSRYSGSPFVATYSDTGAKVGLIKTPGTSVKIGDFNESGETALVVSYGRYYSPSSSYLYLLGANPGSQPAKVARMEAGGDVRFRGEGFLVTSDYAVSALTADGAPDASFGKDGAPDCSRPNVYSGTPEFADVDSQGRVVTLSGSANGACDGLDRFTADGQVEADFGVHPWVTFPMTYDRQLFADGSGRIFVVGWSGLDGGAVIRAFDPEGKTDESFGNMGTLVVPARTPTFDSVEDSEVQKGGRLVTVGTTRCSDYQCEGFGLARFRRDGRIDRTFGTNGFATKDFGGFASAQAVTQTRSGGLLVAGRFGGDGAVALYEPNGHLDTAFGEGGLATASAPKNRIIKFSDVGVGKGGDIYAFGTTTCGHQCSNWVVTRFDHQGRLDYSYGRKGLFFLDVGGSGINDKKGDFDDDYDRAVKMAFYPDGRFLLSGETSPVGYNQSMGIVRMKATGRPDRSFGNRGISRSWVYVVSQGETAQGKTEQFRDPKSRQPTDLRIGPNGSIYMAASVEIPGVSYGEGRDKDAGSILKFKRDGSIDHHFGSGHGFVDNIDMTYEGINIDRCGRILAGGTLLAGKKDDDFGISRLRSDGRPDRSFSRRAIRIVVGDDRDAHASSLSVSGSRAFVSGVAHVTGKADEFAVGAYRFPKSVNRCRNK